MKRIGILTAGGDTPALNATLHGAVARANQLRVEVVGLIKGFSSLHNPRVPHVHLNPLFREIPELDATQGGTIIGASRDYVDPEDREQLDRIIGRLNHLKVDGLICIGGDGTLNGLQPIAEQMPAVLAPKTIDNDIVGTEYTFGFDTAVSIATDAIDRLHTTAESHHRVMVIEVMGRHTGWIALNAGTAGGADCILIPEDPVEMSYICDLVKGRKQRGKTFSLVVVAEGFVPHDADKFVVQDEQLDEFGHVRLGGIGHLIGAQIENLTGIETRVTILGHIQRGGSPTPYDRVLATRYGVAAADLIHKGEFGRMVALQASRIESIPLSDIVGKIRNVDLDLYETAKVFFG